MLLVSLEIINAHGKYSLNNGLHCYIFWTPQTVNQGPHTVFMELLLHMEIEMEGGKKSLNLPLRGGEPRKEPRTPQIQVALPRVSLVALVCLQSLKRLWQGANDFFCSDSSRVIREPGVSAWAHTATLPTRVLQSPEGQSCWGFEQATGGEVVTGDLHEERHPRSAPSPPLLRTGSCTSVRVSGVYLGPTYSTSDQPHLTTSGEQVRADAWRKSEMRIFLDRRIDKPLSFSLWARPLSVTSLLQSELKQHVLGQTISDPLWLG